MDLENIKISIPPTAIYGFSVFPKIPTAFFIEIGKNNSKICMDPQKTQNFIIILGEKRTLQIPGFLF